MRFHVLSVYVLLVVSVSYVHCGCDSTGENDSNEGDVTTFFKNLGCDIKKGAGKISDSAKPWVDEIGKSAKKFGGTVADTFSDLKEKITGPSNSTTDKADDSSVKPTEGVPAKSSSSELPTPSSIDDRILLDIEPRCPEGKQSDGRGHCRTLA